MGTTITFGVRWDDPNKKRKLTSLLVLALALALLATTGSSQAAPAGETVSVIVRELPGAGDRPEQRVRALGGTVGRRLRIIDGFVAEVPRERVPALEAAHGVLSATQDAALQLTGALDDDSDDDESDDKNDYDNRDSSKDDGSMHSVAQEVTGAGEFWNDGYTGKGVDVALIDSGVVPVDGLSQPGKVVYGADLSFESQAPNLRHLDTFGHGTHMAGIIAGRDNDAPARVQKGEKSFVGMAPDARIVSVKVADSYGAVDTSQVIAAIDWVVQNRKKHGLNIRVLNLSFGTDGDQDYRVDPLAYAAEVAWRKGIVVVVSAGNSGYGTDALSNPAHDPFVISVGGADGNGTYGSSDDEVPSWSKAGNGRRDPDLVAPGKSIVSLRAPGSAIDLKYPQGRVGSRFFRGSGTSQAAAVVSGAAALIISQRPSITPNQVKKLLTSSAQRIPSARKRSQGAGMIDLKSARDRSTPSTFASMQVFLPSIGIGSLELTRGSGHLDDGTAVLRGEQDIFGEPWKGYVWSLRSLAGTSWIDGLWNSSLWTGSGFTGNRWDTARWSGTNWSGNRWDTVEWEGNRWEGNRWEGNRWEGNRWEGNRWEGNRWEGNRWEVNSWSAAYWGR